MSAIFDTGLASSTSDLDALKSYAEEETGEFEPAISLLKQALPVALQVNKELQANILNYLALSYKGLGDEKEALQYYEQYVGIQDTLNKEKVSRTFEGP